MSDATEQDVVVAPGGPRPASTVTTVAPGAVVDAGALGTPSPAPAAEVAQDLVVTPGGPRPRSQVHLIGPEQRLQLAAGEFHIADAAGTVVTRVARVGGPPVHQAGRALRKPAVGGAAPGLGTGWITYSSWLNTTGTPISSFVTTWTVPRAPKTHSGQVIFFFNGIEPSDYSHILQPVLQWGTSAAGGGNYWAVASWYVGGGNAFHTNLVQVNEGDVLVGLMTLVSRSGALFNYASSFEGIANTTLNVTNNPELTWASETLEAYSLTQCSDYPATDDTPMTQIRLATGATVPTLHWSVNNAVADCGQSTVIAVDGATAGEVDLNCRGEARWKANDLTTAAGAPLSAGDPFGYTYAADSTEHNVYRGFDGHIHELWFNGSWHHHDLTAATAAPAAQSDPIGYTWDVDSTEHVVYIGLDNHVHELWFNGSWHHNDLTVAGSAPTAVGRPAGYTYAVDHTEHVIYRGSDSAVHELWFNGSWHHNNLTTAAGAPLCASNPAGYTWSVDNTEHAVYRGFDGHVHELWFNGSWHHNDLTAAAGAPLAVGDPAGYTWSADSTEHVVYRGSDGHIHELWFNGSWHRNDLTDAAGGPPQAGSDPTGYTWSADSTEHVVYRGVDGRIHELWFNGAWNYNDLTGAAGGTPLAQGKPTAYTWDVDHTEHVVYRTAANHIEELYL